MTVLWLAMSLVFALFVSVFAVQNAVVLPVQFFTWRFESSLVVIILLSALAGALVVAGIALLRQIRSSVKHWEMRARIADLEAEVKNLKAQQKVAQATLAR